jgi:inorganic pyrophosphatase
MDEDPVVEVLIENPLGSTVRMAFEPERGWVQVGPVFTVPLPAEYGHVPGTRNPADGDPADALVIGCGPTFPGCSYRVRPIALLLRADGDHKVLAVPHTAEYVAPLRDLAEVEPEVLQRIEEWFRPHFVLLGWRDASRAREWLAICRAVEEVQRSAGRVTHKGVGET